MNKVVPLDHAVALIPPGAAVGIGGVLLQQKPMVFLAALAATGITNLRAYSFLASVDIELLAAGGCLDEVHAGYVGFEQLGPAPRYSAAVGAGQVTAVEYSELLFTAGLQAAGAGLPFMPTKGGAGSQVLADLGFAEMTCPYSGQTVTAVPALTLDVTVLHAAAADVNGNVIGPPGGGQPFLHDLDATMARAARTVVVTVDRLISDAEIRERRDRTMLYSFEVDAVVLCPRGAAPTGLPGLYDPDLSALDIYLRAATDDPGAAGTALSRLMDQS